MLITCSIGLHIHFYIVFLYSFYLLYLQNQKYLTINQRNDYRRQKTDHPGMGGR